MEEEKFYWDPVGDTINENSFKEEQLSLLSSVAKYQNNPNLLKIYLAGFCLFPILGIFIFLFYHFFIFLFISFIPPITFYFYVKKLGQDCILLLISQKNNWIYSPKDDEDRAQKFITHIPKIFNIGHSQKLGDQIWGFLTEDSSKVTFWKGIFTTTVGSGKNQQTFKYDVFILKLLEVMPVSFSLTCDIFDILAKFEHNLQTESEDFNKTFRINVENDDENTKIKVLRILSPSVMVRLLDFSKNYSIKQILFQDNMMVILFKSAIWSPQFTNFFKRIEVNEEDESIFYQSIHDMASLPTEMVQFL